MTEILGAITDGARAVAVCLFWIASALALGVFLVSALRELYERWTS